MFCLKNAHPYEKCLVMWTEMYENYNMEKRDTQQIINDGVVQSDCSFCDSHRFCDECPFKIFLGIICLEGDSLYDSWVESDTENEWKEACLKMILFIERAIFWN